jgi:photosystem II stability/assembly factor-like uncharacterized protein
MHRRKGRPSKKYSADREFVMKKTVILALILLIGAALFAATTPQARLTSFEKHKAMKESSLVRQVSWRNVGPYFMGGRIVDIESYAHNPHRVLAAAATGGLWLTENNGTTWRPLFDNESAVGFGDIAVSETDENLIWAGTGEENSGRSIYAGTGVFKSADGGKIWTHMGLADSHHIGQITINPKNNDIVYVAAMGHLYTDNEERGLFKTTDGGKTWAKVLYISPKTGVIDVILDPRDPEVLYAAAWQKDRKAWNFIGNGPESAIYKTKDGGKTWKKLGGGFPQGTFVGRVGLAISPSRPDTVYAVLDNQEPGPSTRPQRELKSGLTADMIKAMTVKDLLALDPKKLEMYLRENFAPPAFTSEKVQAAVKTGEITPKELAGAFSGGAMAAMMGGSIKGAEVYKSADAGETWQKTHPAPLGNMIFSSYGYYFGQIRVSPDNENTVYILGVPAMKSVDGGKTFKEIPDAGGNYGTRSDDVHPDHHALWIDPGNPKVLWLGNDGGLNVSYDGGTTFQKVNNIALAQCYTVSYDMEKPYNLYTGLQDNGVNTGPSDYIYGLRDREWKIIAGGDGAFVEPAISFPPTAPGGAAGGSPVFSEPDTVYAASQFGNITRLNLKNPALSRPVRPRAQNVQPAYRFNWLTPFFVSRHNPYTLYVGGNKVLKSVDRGDNFAEISPDLTERNNIDGNVPYACITALAESPLAPEVLYAGTDDGNVWATRNGGGTWEKIMAGLPKKWVTRLVASQFQRGRVYLTMIGYREDDFSAYIFASEDYGRTWTPIKSNLPDEGINVVREDPGNENLLFIGTDLTVYASFDRGREWHSLKADLPTQPVYDMKIHPREKDLIIATHGRGVFILKIDKLEQLTPAVLAKPLHIFDLAEAFVYPSNVMVSGGEFDRFSASLEFYAAAEGPAKIVIKNSGNASIVRTLEVKAIRGLNAVKWNLRGDDGKTTVSPGKYTVEIQAGGATENKPLVISYPRRGQTP